MSQTTANPGINSREALRTFAKMMCDLSFWLLKSASSIRQCGFALIGHLYRPSLRLHAGFELQLLTSAPVTSTVTFINESAAAPVKVLSVSD